MKTREEATKYGLSFPDTYLETPFHDFFVDKKNPRIEIFLEEIEKGPFDG